MPGPEGSLLNLSENSLDFLILENTFYKKNGYFVDIGAADGIIGSNTFILEKFYNWNGICVDPNPNLIDKLAGSRDCQICSLCAWSASGIVLDFEFPKNTSFYGWNFRAGIKGIIDKTSQEFSSLPVFSITLEDILKLYKAPFEIDYLSLDTEGSEYDILSTFNFLNYKIKFISVEHDFGLQREKIKNLLTNYNYEKISMPIDTNEDVYVLKNG